MTNKVHAALTVEPFMAEIERIEKLFNQLLPIVIARNPDFTYEMAEKLAAELATNMTIGPEVKGETKRPN